MPVGGFLTLAPSCSDAVAMAKSNAKKEKEAKVSYESD